MPLPLTDRKRSWLPPGLPRLNKQHPLAEGLVSLYVPSACGSIIYDLVGAAPLKALAGGTYLVTPEGRGLDSGAATPGGATCLTPPYLKLTSGGFTLFFRGYWHDTYDTYSGNTAPVIGVVYDNADASPYIGYVINSTYNGGYGFDAAWSSGGTNFESSGGFTPALGSMVSCGASFTVGGNVVLYGNGVQVNSTSYGAGAPSFSSTSQVTIGSYPAVSGRATGVTCTIAGIWNRALTADEQAQLSEDPYGLLVFPDDEMLAMEVGVTAILWQGAAGFAGAGLVRTAASHTPSGVAGLPGVGSLRGLGVEALVAYPSPMVGLGSIAGDAGRFTQAYQGAASFGGIGSLSLNFIGVPVASSLMAGTSFIAIGTNSNPFSTDFSTDFGGQFGAYVLSNAKALEPGAGGMAAAASVNSTLTSSLLGSSALSVTAVVLTPASASLFGYGTLASASVSALPAAATLAGIGNEAAAATHTPFAALAFAGAGGIGVDFFIEHTAQAAFAGTSQLAVDTTLIKAAISSLSASGAFRGSAFLRAIDASTLTGTGSVALSATAIELISANLPGSSAVVAQSGGLIQAGAAFVGAGGNKADLSHAPAAAASFSAIGSLAAIGSRWLPASPAIFAGQASVVIGTTSIISLFGFDYAALFGQGSIITSGTSIFTNQAFGGNFAGQGALSIDVNRKFNAAAIFAGSGKLAAPAFVVPLTFTRIWTNDFDLTFGNPTAVAQSSAALAGAGLLSAILVRNQPINAAMFGAGAFSGIANSGISTSWNGSGNLAVIGSIASIAQALLAGNGSEAPRATLIAAARSLIAGNGSIGVAAGILSAPVAAVMPGLGLVAARGAVVPAGAGLLSGIGRVSAPALLNTQGRWTGFGSSSVRLSATLLGQLGVVYQGAGQLSAASIYAYPTGAAFAGIGLIALDAKALGHPTVAYAGYGLLEASAQTNRSAGAALSGKGAFIADMLRQEFGAAALGGVGNLSLDAIARNSLFISLLGQGSFIALADVKAASLIAVAQASFGGRGGIKFDAAISHNTPVVILGKEQLLIPTSEDDMLIMPPEENDDIEFSTTMNDELV